MAAKWQHSNREQQEEQQGGGEAEELGVQVRPPQGEHRNHGRHRVPLQEAEAQGPEVLRVRRQQGQEGNHRAGCFCCEK